METLVLRYGLVAVFLGSAIEGEPFALAGGVLAHRGWLSIPAAALAAVAGAGAIDQLWFALGRRFRESRPVRSISGRPAFRRSLELIERHPIGFVLGFRFAYGVRAVAPVAIGASQVPARLFVPLELVVAVVWGLLFTALGYLAGPAVEAAEARYGPALTIGAAFVSAFAIFWALRRGK